MQALTPKQQAQVNSMGRTNGCGKAFLLTSRKDRNGCNFAILWFTLLYVPVVPLGRYSIRVGEETYVSLSRHRSLSTTVYHVVGATPVVRKEILLTYLIALLIPIVTFVLPFLFLIYAITHGNSTEFIISMLLMFIWPIGSITALIILYGKYTK